MYVRKNPFPLEFLLTIKIEDRDSSSIQRIDFAGAILLLPLDRTGYGCRYNQTSIRRTQPNLSNESMSFTEISHAHTQTGDYFTERYFLSGQEEGWILLPRVQQVIV